jgi:hypothetical protein
MLSTCLSIARAIEASPTIIAINKKNLAIVSKQLASYITLVKEKVHNLLEDIDTINTYLEDIIP